MKVKLRMSLLLLLCLLLCFSSCSTRTKRVGDPLDGTYEDGDIARSIWDMRVWDGKLFIGCGDYDTNRGPCPLWYMDLATEEWFLFDTLPEEQIDAFLYCADMLIVPGTDPVGDEDSSFYIYTEDGFQKQSPLPGSYHTFDLTFFGDDLFIAAGVESGSYPIYISDGASYLRPDFYRDGVLLDTSASEVVRAYDLFLADNQLYTTFSMKDADGCSGLDLYRYEDGRFIYVESLLDRLDFQFVWYKPIGAEAYLPGYTYFTTGSLYRTANGTDFERITVPGVDVVRDLQCFGNDLYLLCTTATDDGQQISVWVMDTLGPRQVAQFDADAPACSFAITDFFIYIGLGGADSASDANGEILRIKRTDPKS